MNHKKANSERIAKTFRSPEAAGEFWDSHDLADFWDQTRQVDDVHIRIERSEYWLALKPSLAKRLRQLATERGIDSEALVNQWLKEKLASAEQES